MRDLVITQNITLDGVIDAGGDWFSAVRDAGTSAEQETALRQQREAADAFLVGRQTYEDMRGFWPAQTDDPTGTSDYLNQVHKYVVSSTLTDTEWEPTTILSGPVRDEVSALKAQQGNDIVVTGSIMLCAELINAGLVEEYRLFVFPVVEGTGARLFSDQREVPRLRLVETQPYDNGVVLLRYRSDLS